MKISARNILKGTVVAVAEGAVNGVVSIKIGDDVVKADITMEAIKSLGAIETASGARIKGSITNEAIEALGLAQGAPAIAVVKSTDVMVGVE